MTLARVGSPGKVARASRATLVRKAPQLLGSHLSALASGAQDMDTPKLPKALLASEAQFKGQAEPRLALLIPLGLDWDPGAESAA